MNWMENLLIVAGISLDIFAAVECQGSLVARVDKKQLTVICVLVTVWQLAALAVGSGLATLLYRDKPTRGEERIGLVLAAVIFFALGVRLIVKAVRNERINERREESLGIRRFLGIASGTGVYTLFTGIAFGLLRTNLPLMLATTVCVSVAVVVTGMYVGYHFGFEHKTKAYIGGAVLLWIAGIDVVMRHMLCYF